MRNTSLVLAVAVLAALVTMDHQQARQVSAAELGTIAGGCDHDVCKVASKWFKTGLAPQILQHSFATAMVDQYENAPTGTAIVGTTDITRTPAVGSYCTNFVIVGCGSPTAYAEWVSVECTWGSGYNVKQAACSGCE